MNRGAARAGVVVALAGISLLTLTPAPGRSAEAAGSVRAEFDDGEVRRILQLSPLGPPPADSNRFAADPRAARLGRMLFFDPRLSLDGATSCATCHDPARGFADGRPLPAGAERHGRHTPSLWNVAYNRWYFWDGRADSLWAQALEPLERASELGGGRLRAAWLIAGDPALRSAYEEVFGPPPDLGAARLLAAGGPLSDDPAEVAAWGALPAADRAAVDQVFVHAGKAIGAYERLLVSRRAPFDRFVEALRRGDEATMRAALTPAARRGLRLFVGRAGCRLCHGGPNFTDGEFHDTGVPSRAPGSPRDAGREAGIVLLRASPFNAAGRWNDDPAGPAAQRLEFLADRPETRGRWKTPTLRNVARTAPYMHQGQLRTFEQVLAHYSTLRGAAFADGHRETVLRPLALSDGEIADLVAFLESLTDESVLEGEVLLPAPDESETCRQIVNGRSATPRQPFLSLASPSSRPRDPRRAGTRVRCW
jgi:cytochrome c peroxidase